MSPPTQSCHEHEAREKYPGTGSDAIGFRSLNRPRFFFGQSLHSDDLSAIVGWAKERLDLQRHRAGWGVTSGLQVAFRAGSNKTLVIQPGHAVAPGGEDLIVAQPELVDPLCHCKAELPPTAEGQLVPIDLCIKIQERPAQPRPTLFRDCVDHSTEFDCSRVLVQHKFECIPVVVNAYESWEKDYKTAIESASDHAKSDADPANLAFVRGRTFQIPDALQSTFEAPLQRLLRFQDQRLRFLRSHSSPASSVPIARLWVHRKGPDDSIVFIDNDPPARRLLQKDQLPAREGEINLGEFIGLPFAEANQRCRQLGFRQLGQRVFEYNDEGIPLYDVFVEGDQLYETLSASIERTLVALCVEVPLLGDRVIAFVAPRETAPQPIPAPMDDVDEPLAPAGDETESDDASEDDPIEGEDLMDDAVDERADEATDEAEPNE